MAFNVTEEGITCLAQYAQVSIGFQVESILQVELVEGGLGGFRLHEQKLATPYWKDYANDELGTTVDWPAMFDLSGWGHFLAWQDSALAGAAAVAFDTPGVNMLEGRTDLSVLWDIRVQPEFRGMGAGRQLFQAAADWSRQRGCKLMKIETQNVNVPACRFYARMGCRLGVIDRFAYRAQPKVSDEVMLLWFLEL